MAQSHVKGGCDNITPSIKINLDTAPKMDGHWMEVEGTPNFRNGSTCSFPTSFSPMSYKALMTFSIVAHLDTSESSSTVRSGAKGEPSFTSLLRSWDECDADVLHGQGSVKTQNACLLKELRKGDNALGILD